MADLGRNRIVGNVNTNSFFIQRTSSMKVGMDANELIAKKTGNKPLASVTYSKIF